MHDQGKMNSSPIARWIELLVIIATSREARLQQASLLWHPTPADTGYSSTGASYLVKAHNRGFGNIQKTIIIIIVFHNNYVRHVFMHVYALIAKHQKHASNKNTESLSSIIGCDII